MTSQVVPGHSLQLEGSPFEMRQELPWEKPEPRLCRTPEGSALCECGAMSFSLTSRRQRQQWHRDHKAAVLTLRRMGLENSVRTQCPANHAEQCCGDLDACHRTA